MLDWYPLSKPHLNTPAMPFFDKETNRTFLKPQPQAQKARGIQNSN